MTPLENLIADPSAGVFETILMVDGRLIDLEWHLERLSASVVALYQRQLPARVQSDLERLEPAYRARVRLEAWPEATGLAVAVETGPCSPEPAAGPVNLVPVTLPGGLGRHKWRDRSSLQRLRENNRCLTSDELLLLDSDGEVLETERAGVLIVEGRSLVATPDDDRRLPSLLLRRVVELAPRLGLEVCVEPMDLERLLQADEVLLASSIRGVVSADACAGSCAWPSRRTGQALAVALMGHWVSTAVRPPADDLGRRSAPGPGARARRG